MQRQEKVKHFKSFLKFRVRTFRGFLAEFEARVKVPGFEVGVLTCVRGTLWD